MAASFLSHFDESNMASANSEIQDMLNLTQLKGKEKANFLTRVRQGLKSKNISLDYLDSF